VGPKYLCIFYLQIKIPFPPRHTLPVVESIFSTMDAVQPRIQEAVNTQRIPGAVVAVTDRSQIVWSQAFGLADRESGRVQRTDDVFFIASSSKPLAATTVFLTTPLDTHLQQLLSHSAGVFGNDTKDPVERDLLRTPHRSLADAASGIAARPLIYTPGEGTKYSDAGIMLAGRAAEVTTGAEFDAVMKSVLLDPLGMRDTFYRTDGSNLAERLGVSYQRVENRLQRAVLQHRLKHDGLIRPGSGLFSTASDLAAFLRFHLNNQERFAEMYRDHTSGRWYKDPMGGTNSGYGLGWQLGDNGVFYHAGAFGSLIWADRVKGIGIVLLTQMPILEVYSFWRQIVAEIRSSGTS
jgi:CubicO group peptidase (beta-lactamase class C family)